MRNLPEWLPGTGFQQLAKKWRAEANELIAQPYAFVKQQLDQGTNSTSFLSRALELSDGDANEDDINKYTAITLYAGGSDTVWYLVLIVPSTHCSFVMSLYSTDNLSLLRFRRCLLLPAFLSPWQTFQKCNGKLKRKSTGSLARIDCPPLRTERTCHTLRV